MTEEKVASKLDDAYIKNNVLVVQYLELTRTADGRYQAHHAAYYFKGDDIEVELARNTAVRDYLSMKIEAEFTGEPVPTASMPTFELADIPRKGSSDV